ncbi:hypothetical protein K1719_029488 [Acacia pycnantha]|nr:hypothetical protein K1719_029488 [Acacia pycnantha]
METENWRVLAALGSLPCVTLIPGLLLIPESPRWREYNGILVVDRPNRNSRVSRSLEKKILVSFNGRDRIAPRSLQLLGLHPVTLSFILDCNLSRMYLKIDRGNSAIHPDDNVPLFKSDLSFLFVLRHIVVHKHLLKRRSVYVLQWRDLPETCVSGTGEGAISSSMVSFFVTDISSLHFLASPGWTLACFRMEQGEAF